MDLNLLKNFGKNKKFQYTVYYSIIKYEIKKEENEYIKNRAKTS